jgi:hypothetical protein
MAQDSAPAAVRLGFAESAPPLWRLCPQWCCIGEGGRPLAPRRVALRDCSICDRALHCMAGVTLIACTVFVFVTLHSPPLCTSPVALHCPPSRVHVESAVAAVPPVAAVRRR